ncbi:MAG: sodium:solute symporter family protein [Methermicoccaceae archaeon]
MKRQKSMSDFWIAGREIGVINVGFSAASSWLTAGAFLFVTGLFVLMGVGSIWIFVVPNVLALILIGLLSPKIKRLPTITQPELLEMRYSPLLRVPIAVFITIMMTFFAVADFKGFSYVLSVFYDIPETYAVLLVIIAVGAYVSLGGFRAVVWTDIIQFGLLASVAIGVAYMAFTLPPPAEVVTQPIDAGWWNPLSLGGISAILILLLALLPGWVTEQDQWQKVWAARDVKVSRYGMFLGAGLMAMVFLVLFITAIGFRTHLPMPADEMAAEYMYLQFLVKNASTSLLTIFAIGFAAASMSCIDTFSTSGASCLSRDIYQRFIHPDAPMSRMRLINRIAVITIIVSAGLLSLKVESILDAIIMGTVVGSASVFFPMIGGMFWKGATKWGGFGAMVMGGSIQIGLILFERVNGITLDTYSPLLTDHGVLLSLAVSGLSFFTLSLFTSPSTIEHLAPFFDEPARKLRTTWTRSSPDEMRGQYLSMIDERWVGNKLYLSCSLEIDELDWGKFVSTITERKEWIAPGGTDTVYRLGEGELLRGVQVIRGTKNQVWLSSEQVSPTGDLKDELLEAILEVRDVLSSLGMHLRESALK